jgi:hypothetical protein
MMVTREQFIDIPLVLCVAGIIFLNSYYGRAMGISSPIRHPGEELFIVI